MRQISVIVLFSLIVALSACSSETGKEASGKIKQAEIDKTEETMASGQEKSANKNDEINNKEDANAGKIQEESEIAEGPLYKLNENNWTIEPIDHASPRVVLLTIDDAPDTYALEMAETLKRLGAPAIFFVNGHFIDTPEEAKVLKAIHDLGFSIGNHTYSHPNLKKLPEKEQYKEIVGLNDRIEEIIGERPKFFRAPFGSNTDYSKKIARDEKMLLMNWTYGYDWEKDYQSKEALADIMVNSPYLVEGANLLMHDRQWTKDALQDIVKGIQNKGFEFVDPAKIQTVD
ncbi:polysaccharide deacetylase family protein [Bacillus sp. J33]|uniref:polysaccharide deacetylase family protein n=1 Tax=Bacillus sp. J33 TaxID=935836 RepID=UPI000478F047|nr:polysaccharide deacetylase family protein [Bacillus sp. J33]